MRHDDPLVLRVQLHSQTDPDPTHLQTTATEAGSVQTRPRSEWSQRVGERERQGLETDLAAELDQPRKHDALG